MEKAALDKLAAEKSVPMAIVEKATMDQAEVQMAAKKVAAG